MDPDDWLAERFEENRPHLRAVAYRMLGSASEAEDAVQESWLRLSRSDTDEIKNLGGWLTTVVGRVCLDMLRSRTSRREESLEIAADPAGGTHDPENEAVLADSVGLALLVVLDTLDPAERLAFVLHDMFAVPFEEIAGILGRTPAAARQLASRARRRVQGRTVDPEADLQRQHRVVEAFLNASREGDFAGLLALLDPDIVVRADATATRMGGSPELHGTEAAVANFLGRAQAVRPALVDGHVAGLWADGDKAQIMLRFTVVEDRITAIDVVADRAVLDQVTFTFLP
ncbi:sigma-70 family RNA polymerase sigma factor [Hamadaea tsunoensis]|uniref:sigma-70 family RNA polymerase sigma factor n=1 Tax=Hamadaea tsunoensis TaxID=53368 RepID=UPI0004016B60|nr:sigma-70 family RNA polymerase sigma factor [Hamadaea tsunoensis]